MKKIITPSWISLKNKMCFGGKMSRLTNFTLLLLVFIIIGLAACSGGTPTTDPSLVLTQIWQTVEVAQAQTALAASATPSITNTPALNETQQATNTPLITNTLLPGVPSATPFSISTSTPGATRSAACDNANFVKDVTIPDGTEVPAGSTFVKTWRFKNLGPCTWTTSYHLLFSYMSDSGKNGVFEPPAPVGFPNTVLPGEEVELSVTLTAPTKAGTYQIVFVLRNNKGFSIPLINYNTYEFWVNFVVK
jgi:hypothetical protein